jgi:hypothetical protein
MRATGVLVLCLAGSGLAGCGARTQLDAPDLPSVPTVVVACKKVTSPPLFVVTDENHLFRFDPPSGAFELIGSLPCADSQPETMAVSYDGTAYVTYQDGSMFEVTSDAAMCTRTAFADGPNDGRFGSCFAKTPGFQGETLYLLDSQDDPPNGALVAVDTQSFAVTTVGGLSAYLGGGELTGTGDGRLFAFTNNLGMSGSGQSALAQLDPKDGTVLSAKPVDVPIPATGGWAFAFWGGSFYFFTGESPNGSTVARLDPDGTLTPNYATLANDGIVGAGVSVCAPVN